MLIRVSAVDAAFSNFGTARLMLDTETSKFTVERLYLIETDRQVNKVVRQNSDDLRRAKELVQKFHRELEGCAVCFAEVPSGGKSARAVYGFGIAVGVLAGSPVPVIQVQPAETKLATVGTKTASKEEMIEWAVENYPSAPWIRRKFKGRMELTGKNEHLADALAIAHAGIETDQFQQLMAIWKASSLAA